jgi:acylphosphatase
MAETKRVRATIAGRVQGVWYRASTQEQAERLGVSGWVRNLPGGSVEAVFEGSPDAVAAMVRWCWEGPPQASVSDVSVEEEAPEGLDGFRVTG